MQALYEDVPPCAAPSWTAPLAESSAVDILLSEHWQHWRDQASASRLDSAHATSIVSGTLQSPR